MNVRLAPHLAGPPTDGAVATHPDHPGARLVPLGDVEACLRRRELTPAVHA